MLVPYRQAILNESKFRNWRKAHRRMTTTGSKRNSLSRLVGRSTFFASSSGYALTFAALTFWRHQGRQLLGNFSTSQRTMASSSGIE
eukprot:284818933_2